MASDFFLAIKSQKSGDIKCESNEKGKEGQIIVDRFSFGVTSPEDSFRHDPTGARFWEAMEIKSLACSASPILVTMLTTNENIVTAVLTCRKAGGLKGELLDYQWWTLSNARMTTYKQSNEGEHVYDVYRISFQKIEFKYQSQKATGDGGGTRTANDDLGGPTH
jgi:type VI secretion system Hcp family effector